MDLMAKLTEIVGGAMVWMRRVHAPGVAAILAAQILLNFLGFIFHRRTGNVSAC